MAAVIIITAIVSFLAGIAATAIVAGTRSYNDDKEQE